MLRPFLTLQMFPQIYVINTYTAKYIRLNSAQNIVLPHTCGNKRGNNSLAVPYGRGKVLIVLDIRARQSRGNSMILSQKIFFDNNFQGIKVKKW